MILVGVLDDKIQQTPVMADDEGAPLRMLYCKTIYRHPRLMKSKNAKRCRSDLTTIVNDYGVLVLYLRNIGGKC